MGNREEYYGSEKISSLSYLEFGSIDLEEGKKTIWAYWQDQKAYDMYMFSRYARDLFAFRKFLGEKEKSVEIFNEYVKKTAHVKLMDYLFKYVGLISVRGDNYICESGSSLYGWIDEAIAADTVYFEGKNIERIRGMKFLGSDISEFMNEGAKAFHSDMDMNFSTAPTIKELTEEGWKFSLFYGLGVSMRYALRTAADLTAIAEQSELAIFNRLSFTRDDETVKMIYGTGKYEYVISLPEFVRLLELNDIKAKYCTANMQKEKDGRNSVRVSVAIAKDEKRLNEFIEIYSEVVKKSLGVEFVVEGDWRELKEL